MKYNTYERLPPDPVIGALIKERKRRGWTQGRISRRLFINGKPISQSTLSAYERRISDPGLTFVRDWAAVLGLVLGDLVPLTIGQSDDSLEGTQPSLPEVDTMTAIQTARRYAHKQSKEYPDEKYWTEIVAAPDEHIAQVLDPEADDLTNLRWLADNWVALSHLRK